MSKKTYQTPKVERVQLKITNAILAVCHSSPTMTPAGGLPGSCSVGASACFSPAL